MINVSIPDRSILFNQSNPNEISSIQPQAQKYNLELFKKRTKKNSNRIIGKTGLKWSILGGDQNYSSNLPMIGKTQSTYMTEHLPLNESSNSSFQNYQKEKNSSNFSFQKAHDSAMSNHPHYEIAYSSNNSIIGGTSDNCKIIFKIWVYIVLFFGYRHNTISRSDKDQYNRAPRVPVFKSRASAFELEHP